MPLFGLLPYDDEEERRRRMLTPPINPDAPVRLPDIPAPRTLPPPSRSIPGEIPDGPMMGAPGSSPLPESSGPRGMMLPTPNIPGGEKYGIPGVRASRPPTRYDELAEMKGAYMSGTPGRGKSALTGALEGFMGGGGLAGAATGAAYGAIDPRRLRERQFERYERPGILERFAFEDMDRARARQAEKDVLDEEYRRAQTGALNRSNQPRQMPPPRPISTPRGALDPATRTIIPGTEPLPPAPRERATKFAYDVNGLPYDLNNPEDRKRFESLPRNKRVKPEKSAGRGRGAKKTSKTFTMEDVDDAVAETGLSELKIKQRFIEKGYREVK